MEVQFTRDQEEFIVRSVQNGRFSSPDDAVREAVELLERHEAALQETRAFVQEGLGDLEAGDYADFTDENLTELFDGVARRGQERLATEKKR